MIMPKILVDTLTREQTKQLEDADQDIYKSPCADMILGKLETKGN